MKNKKLIATIASLCLVVVAVVAAVVGVLAASQATIGTTKISITYEANDVYATVSANAYRLTNNGSAKDETASLLASTTFTRDMATATATATAYEKTFLSTKAVIVYHLQFDNLNATNDMNILVDYVVDSVADNNSNKNTVAWFKWSHTEIADSALAPTWTGTTPAGTTVAAPTGFSPVAATMDAKCDPASASNTDDTQHLYIVVAVNNLDADASYFLESGHNTMNITLQRAARSGSGS